MESEGLWASGLCVGRTGTRAMAIIKLRLSTAILPSPLPQTREMSEEEWEDPEPGRNLAFGAVAANRVGENLGVVKKPGQSSSGTVRNKAFQVQQVPGLRGESPNVDGELVWRKPSDAWSPRAPLGPLLGQKGQGGRSGCII